MDLNVSPRWIYIYLFNYNISNATAVYYQNKLKIIFICWHPSVEGYEVVSDRFMFTMTEYRRQN